MSYTENYQKWLDFAELPAYLRDELVSMDEKLKKMPSILILNSVQLVCVV
jgi:alpha-phosphoglucomutase (EC 5.4.2.2)